MEKLAQWRSQLAKALKGAPIDFAYLFGSHAAGRARKNSDVDIAIYPKAGLSESQRFRLRLQVTEAVMDALHEDHVDVVDLHEATLPLRFRAIQPSCLLFSRKEKKRVRFEVATRSAYFDRLPMIERSVTTALKRTAQKGLR